MTVPADSGAVTQVFIGELARPVGLSGEVAFRRYRPRRNPVSTKKQSSTCTVSGPDGAVRPLLLRSVRWQTQELAVVGFLGIDDREAALSLGRSRLAVDVESLVAELADELDGWMGADVCDRQTGDSLGLITDLQDNGVQTILVVGDDGQILIPVTDDFIHSVEPEGARVQTVWIEPIPGLLEVNQTRKAGSPRK